MGARRRLKKEMLFIVLSLCLNTISTTSCRNSQIETPKEQYVIYETAYDSCSIYKMIFKSGEYTFRFALSGSCNTITKEIYVSDYKIFLAQYKNEIDFESKKYIRLEYYKSLKVDSKTLEQIVVFTEEILKKKIIVIDSWEEGCKIQIE